MADKVCARCDVAIVGPGLLEREGWRGIELCSICYRVLEELLEHDPDEAAKQASQICVRACLLNAPPAGSA